MAGVWSLHRRVGKAPDGWAKPRDETPADQGCGGTVAVAQILATGGGVAVAADMVWGSWEPRPPRAARLRCCGPCWWW